MLAWLERHRYLVLVLAALLLVAGVATRELHHSDSPDLIFHDDSLLPDGTPIRVEVAGAVAAPGVYELQAGDRVVEALAAAGGALDNADLDLVNQARRVRDEEKVTVPTQTAGSPKSPAAKAAPMPAGSKLDINTATQAQLDQLPGIGDAYSRHIVDSRAVDGPFKSTDDLVQRKVLPKPLFDRISGMLTVSSQ